MDSVKLAHSDLPTPEKANKLKYARLTFDHIITIEPSCLFYG